MLLAFTFAVLCISGFSSARELQPGGVIALQERLAASDGGGGVAECLSALLELRSCTNEIVLFFLNGESYLSLDCCRAIRVITRSCWPSMLTSIGFTAEEGDILCGFCDAGDYAGDDASKDAAPPPAGPGAPSIV